MRWLVLLAALAAGAAHAQAPLERTYKLIEIFKADRAAPEGGKLSTADAAANAKTVAALDGFFDFETFTAACLGPSAVRLSGAQQKEFKERLVDLLRKRGYPNGGSVFREGVLSFAKPVEEGGRTRVPLTISFPKQDLTMDVAFVWGKSGRVVDLMLDGDSLVKDYSNQVSRIVAKGGPEELLRRLAEKQRQAAQDVP